MQDENTISIEEHKKMLHREIEINHKEIMKYKKKYEALKTLLRSIMELLEEQ